MELWGAIIGEYRLCSVYAFPLPDSGLPIVNQLGTAMPPPVHSNRPGLSSKLRRVVC